LIVCFGLGGAIYYNSEDGGIDSQFSQLYFDPKTIEGWFWNEKKLGSMKGLSAIFISSLVSKLYDTLQNSKDILQKNNISSEILRKGIDEGIRYGLVQKQNFMREGHGYIEETGEPPMPDFFGETIQKSFSKDQKSLTSIQKIKLPPVNSYSEPDELFWKIMEDETRSSNVVPLRVAKAIVRKGSNAIEKYPIGTFGNLTTVDRAETESFRSIMNIMTEYINSEKKTEPKKRPPLSIAVFGSPGSGKSFGITEIAKTIDKERVKKIEFNVSQFTSLEDLISAFHVIRDCSLKGIIPRVFFDEFDCTFQDQPLGWLRYFLVPMQEGEFLDHGRMHPIGKSIFVFAGGVYENFTKFCDATGVGSNDTSTSRILFSEKGPDFVSRLRGYVNILGPNPTDDDRYGAYIIRRAILLRSLIEEKAPYLITNAEISNNNLDDNLLELLLDGVKYKHGTRSMVAIMEMSLLREGNIWQIASLPSKEQLKLHIDVDFCKFYNNKSEKSGYYPVPTIDNVNPNSGPGDDGNSVIITGSGLTGTTAVKFGSTAATNVVVVSDSSITATSPAGTGTVHVTVTTPGGTSATSSADHFTFEKRD